MNTGSSRINRWLRDLWNIGWNRIPSRRIRRQLLKRILGHLSGRVYVGLNVKLFDPSQIKISDRSVINAGCLIDARGGLVAIAEDVDVGAETHIWTLEHDPNDPEHGTRGGGVTIEDHVWIATRVTILPNVTIGRGAVIGCGSVVTKNIPPMAIAVGVPAKVIGERDNPLTYKLNYNPRFR